MTTIMDGIATCACIALFSLAVLILYRWATWSFDVLSEEPSAVNVGVPKPVTALYEEQQYPPDLRRQVAFQQDADRAEENVIFLHLAQRK